MADRDRLSSDQLPLDLDRAAVAWPPHARFPYNFGGDTVSPRVEGDLLASPDPLLVTGYASVERLLGFFLRYHTAGRRPGRVRLLVGVEPMAHREEIRSTIVEDFEGRVADYWLGRGISLLNSRDLVATLELIDEGRLEVRSSGSSRVHAKIYVSAEAVTLGSSNFTRPGLETNLEANVRFERRSEEARYREAVALAENLWHRGRSYTADFRDLLDRLLKKVTWQEALARASAELLEGDWVPGHLLEPGDGAPLWPSQEQGIAQALWVLENHGAVLIADATGSGKTRMGAHLLRALQDHNWRTGRSRTRFPVVVCPPAVGPLWARELAQAAEPVNVYSHGTLSRRTSHRRDEVEEALRRTQLLTVDEAHNFLNRVSQRSRVLYGNVADNVILLTATPINRGVRDLLAIVELLGADNFADDVLKVVGRLARHRRTHDRRPMRETERSRLRSALQEFVVRRTKPELNRLVDREPERYVNALGQRCRFPRHKAVVFEREDPAEDCSRATAIREKAKNLRGVVNFRRELKMPAFLRMEGWTEERFLMMRLNGASALAAYQVRSRLRSSKVALVEHILGTREASSRFGIGEVKTGTSGDVIATLKKIAGHPPRIALGVDVPAWLADPDEHRRAAEEEIGTYEDILEQVEHMSDHRMDANAGYLLGLLDDHPRVLAFDSHLISLYDLRRRLRDRGAGDVVLATGEGGMRARRAFGKRFALGASEEGVIGLCSDALAEGLNLQGASALVHLDLPSVIRILEQRIGRIDRMDSPHAQVEVYWPDEPRAFTLRSDERLFWRLREVEDLLGSNVPIPEEFETYQAEQGDYLDVRDIIEAVDREEAPAAAMTLADAFERVRTLISGNEAIVPQEIYDAVRTSKARVLSSVAVVATTESPWVFLAVGGADRSAPRWVLVEGGTAHRVEGTLDRVADEVRDRLVGGPEDLGFDESAAEVLGRALATAETQQRALLSRRKRSALDELENIVQRYDVVATRAKDHARAKITKHILGLLETSADDFSVDLGQLARWWLQLVRPEWYEHLTRRGIRRPARLRHLRKRLKNTPISTERLETVNELALMTEPLDRRVVAAIVGVARPVPSPTPSTPPAAPRAP